MKTTLSRFATAAFFVLVVCYLAFVAWTHPQLPDRMAIHFDWNGEPDGWGSRNVFTGVFFGIGVLFLFLFGFGSIFFAKLPPSCWNLPNKDYWLAPERRDATASAVSGYYLVIGIATIVFLGFTYWATAQFALGHREKLPLGLWEVGLELGIVAVVCVLMYRRFSKLPEDAVTTHQ